MGAGLSLIGAESLYANPLLLFATLILVPITAMVLYIVLKQYGSPLTKVPCYKAWPIVGDALHLKRDQTALYTQILDILETNRKHSLFRFSFGATSSIALYDPVSVEKLLRSQKYIDKSIEYDVLLDWLGTGLLISTGSKWRARRRLLTPSFHFSILQDFAEVINSHALSFKEQLEELSGKGEAFDINVPVTLNSLDVICDTAMGVNTDALHDNNSEYVNAIYLVKEAMAVRARTPWYWPDIVYNNLPVGRRVKKCIKLMHEFALKVIKERRQMHSEDDLRGKHQAFLDTLLDARDEQGQLLTDDDIREEVDTFMFEGHDTVSSALAHTIHLIGANPEHQRKCQKELDAIFDGPREITTEDLAKMNYLEWCIKESMRIFPSVPWIGRCLSEDSEFNGYLIPKGTSVFVYIVSLHRDPKIYPNPEKFDPLRFSPEQAAARHPYAYIPFSAGPRNCIGQRFAMMEMKITLAVILRSFNIKSTQTREEIKPCPNLVLQPNDGIWVELTNRE